MQGARFNPWSGNQIPHTTTKTQQSQINKYMPPFSIYPVKNKVQKDTCTLVFIATLLTIAKTRKQPKCPLAEEWIRLRELTYCYRGKAEGRDSQGDWDGHVPTTMFKIDSQQGPTVQHIDFCSMLRGSLDGRTDTCICMTVLLFCALETITTLLTSYTPIQNKKFK